MFRCKRDVDRHVAELEDKFPSVTERSLKYFTVARLYFNVGESELSVKYLDKYCEVRPSSAQAFKFRGQILEKAAENEANDEQSSVKRLAAVEAYKTSYHLDLSQKELLLKICELSARLPVNDFERTRYWVEQGEKQFPRNKLVAKLRDRMRAMGGEGELNGNGQASTEDSPTSQGDDLEADNSILWSNSRLGGSFALNGSYRLEDALNSTPGNRSNAATRRFQPRPSPERLANQIRQVESAQEKMSSAILENSRSLLETNEAVLNELRKTREDFSRNLRENTEAVRDLRGEIGSIWRELRDEMRRSANKKQEVIVVKDEKPSAPAAIAGPKPLDMQDLQEALAQQAALIQMSSLSMAGMFAQAARPPVPLGGVVPPPIPPHMLPTVPTPQPTLPQHPTPVVSSHHPAAAAASNTPVNVVITSSDKIPSVNSNTTSTALPAVNIPPQHRLGGVKPAVSAETTSSPSSQHSYQINISSKQTSAGPPFAEKDGPAVPISTSSILSGIPAPVISAVPPKTTTATPKQEKPVTAAAPVSSFDKFKPKPGSWECGGCFLRQNPDVIQCPACQAAKPGHEEEVKAKEAASKPTISFGDGGGFKFPGGGNANPTATSTPSLGGFSFGSPATTNTTPSQPPAASKPSAFAGFSFGNATSTPTTGGFSFTAPGVQPVSSASSFTLNTSKQEPEPQDESHDDSNAHDPHFEPIIPLPELVQVTTGEEEEEVKFKYRSKVFRWDKDTKEWKERGVGELKILFHPDNKTYRVLLRRDQVHKIACNHYITTDMVLEPMAKSETAITWFAMDYSDDGEARVEKLAARFKLAETKDEFKRAFEEAQEFLRTKPPSPQKPAQKAAQPAVSSSGEDFELSFEGQGLKLNNAKDAESVVAKINATKHFTTLTFSGNTVGIEAAESIGKALEKHPELKFAHWKDMFTGRMKTEIPPALNHLSKGLMTAKAQLVELDLSDNAFGPIGMDGIVDLLKSPTCFTLKELKLNNTGCGVTGGKKLANTLMEAYTASKGQFTLRVFVLGRSRQENDGAIALAKVFKAMKSLEEVVMPQNGIYFEGLTALADAFASNPNLRILNMNDNTFTEKGAKAFAEALPKLNKLEVLNLGDCLLKTEGARHIAYAIKEGHHNLREWHMDSNEIRLAGGFAIVDALANKDKIQVLTLDTNQFGADGCGRIMKKLEILGKRHVLDEIEDDEEPEDSDAEEEDEDEDDEEGEGNIETLSSSFANEKPVASLFGGSSTPAKPNESSSIFSGLKSSGSSNLFGGSAASPAPSTSIFGGSSNNSSTTPTLFGGNSSTPSIFGQSAGTETGSIFGSAKPATGGIFGNSQDNANSPASSVFGGAKTESKGIDLSASKDLPSFASLGGNTGGFAFGKKTEGFSFEGTGTSLFGQANKDQSAHEDADAAEEEAHDPHFEPIVPLPELINVTTGEEDEEPIFKHRAKVYRFDPDAKQWKERGVGDIKILHHVARNTFRILLRRDQVHKIACNHYINEDQQLEPMSSSETALTWFAMDFSEDEANGRFEKLAVKFKLAETKDEFKKIFEESQKKLKDKPQQEAMPAKPDEDEDDDAEYEDEETADDDQSDDSDNTMFERTCDMLEVIGDNEQRKEVPLGKALLRIVYDEDVYGARIIASKINDDENYLLNHLIAIQTNVEVGEENRRCTWSGLDFSVDPPRYRKFVAIFSDSDGDEDPQVEFVAIFQEGKDLAEQSEILEQPMSGSINPEDMYYGVGGDYDA